MGLRFYRKNPEQKLYKVCVFIFFIALNCYLLNHLNTIVVAKLKVVLKANYTWIQISRMRRSLEQIKQFEVNFQTKSIDSYNSKKITKRQTQFQRDG